MMNLKDIDLTNSGVSGLVPDSWNNLKFERCNFENTRLCSNTAWPDACGPTRYCEGSQMNLPLIIGLSVAGGLVFVLLVVALAIFYHRKQVRHC
jgi:hypothetical protein